MSDMVARARFLRRSLSIPIMLRAPASLTRRQMAEHEAAHTVLSMAVGGISLFSHVGKTLGGVNLSPSGSADGIFVAIVPPVHMGMLAVAGMTQNKASALGFADAELLMRWLSFHVGQWPRRHPVQTEALITTAKVAAADLLRENREAVSAVATAIDRGPIFHGKQFRAIAGQHMRLPSLRVSDVSAAWRAIVTRGDDAAKGRIPIELWSVADLARKEFEARK